MCPIRAFVVDAEAASSSSAVEESVTFNDEDMKEEKLAGSTSFVRFVRK